MKRVFGLCFFLALVGAPDVLGQTEHPPEIGFYVGTRLTSTPQGAFRFGASYSWKLIGPIEAYPALDLVPEDFGTSDAWQLNLHVRVWPLGRGTAMSFWFVGAGVVVQSTELFPALVTGLTTTAPVGSVTPFVQLQISGLRTSFNAGATLTAGFTIARR